MAPGSAIDLQDGAAGIAILHACRGERQAALALVDRAEQALADMPLPLDLFTGVVGVAWCSDQVRAILGEEDPERNEPVDELLLAHLERGDWPFHYDLGSGLVGFGLYGLTRGARGRGIAERALHHLRGFAREGADGIGFFTAAALLPAHQRQVAPDGFYQLGVAHGGAGAVGFLAGCLAADIAGARALLEPAVAWLLARRTPGGFPLAHGVDSPTVDGWCHGAPGIALVLDAAGRAAGMSAWREAALDIARDAARRTGGAAAGGLCHGAAGLGRIYAALGRDDEEVAAAGRALLVRAADLPVAEDDPGFLTGAAGTALALAGGPDSWWRFFLAAGPTG
jgi:hypothetical protein